MNFIWRHHQGHTDMLNMYTNAKYVTSYQVQEFVDVADQLVFIMDILEKNDPETIQREAIKKILVITTVNQSHLRESQKS
jgi:uncharacterized lipoprotein YbaY